MDVDTNKDGVGDGFKWGNMEVEGVYIGEQIRRMCTNYRDNFARVARKLIEEGKKDKAKEVLDRCMELMPKHKVPYNFFTTYIADAYFKLGDQKKQENN